MGGVRKIQAVFLKCFWFEKILNFFFIRRN